METYLIARAKKEDRDYKKGFDSIVKLDYMGASEYEWGAIPKSLERIRSEIKKYIYFDVNSYGVTVTVFCKKEQKSDISSFLDKLGSGDMRTKNGHYFDMYINYDQKSDMAYIRDRVDFWWDIENDLMFWIKDEYFSEKFKQVINKKPK